MAKLQAFIDKSNSVHQAKYTYTRVDYVNASTPVTITCPTHGDFTQKPRDHVQGSGCQQCSGKQQLTTSTFIERAQAVHGNKFNYTAVNYVKNNVKVTIICPTHGPFDQRPMEHLRGNGCSKCYGRALMSTSEFIQRAEGVHGGRYDYSRVTYTGNEHPVTLICRDHGEFTQTPNNHINGRYGCPKCSHARKDGRYNAKFFEKFPERRSTQAKLYLLEFVSLTSSFIKVGITVQDTLRHRFRMSIYDGYCINVLAEYDMPLYDAWLAEAQCLKEFVSHKHTGHVDDRWYGKHELITVDQAENVLQFLKTTVDPKHQTQDTRRILIDRS